MEPTIIEDASSLKTFLQNKYVVLFYSKTEENDVVSKVAAHGLSEDVLGSTHFGSIKGQALYDSLTGMFPLREQQGIVMFKNNRMEHQLVERTFQFFKQCVEDIHLTTTLPPISPALTCNLDMYVEKTPADEPTILPPAKSLGWSAPMERFSTSTLRSNKEAESEKSPEPQAAPVVSETPSSGSNAARSDNAPSCCIVM